MEEMDERVKVSADQNPSGPHFSFVLRLLCDINGCRPSVCQLLPQALAFSFKRLVVVSSFGGKGCFSLHFSPDLRCHSKADAFRVPNATDTTQVFTHDLLCEVWGRKKRGKSVMSNDGSWVLPARIKLQHALKAVANWQASTQVGFNCLIHMFPFLQIISSSVSDNL